MLPPLAPCLVLSFSSAQSFSCSLSLSNYFLLYFHSLLLFFTTPDFLFHLLSFLSLLSSPSSSFFHLLTFYTYLSLMNSILTFFLFIALHFYFSALFSFFSFSHCFSFYSCSSLFSLLSIFILSFCISFFLFVFIFNFTCFPFTPLSFSPHSVLSYILLCIVLFFFF
ncbi:unnamed protein product [Acanthosepion pharaonis]|uniref:Uncharacterized protein n=1 Tax=Acanthosepion pharaonis TaxID=158019 RepID=A0A812CLJ2_ACAPH|nr:unnamed protein product [Sepia pharaonis]